MEGRGLISRNWLRWVVCWVFVLGAGSALAEDADALLRRCAPNVDVVTARAIMANESSGNVFAIADAGPKGLPWSIRKNMVRSFFPATLGEAVATARTLINQGHTVSLGPMQINDRNLGRYGLSLESVFDTCTNVATGEKILTDCYSRAVRQFGKTERALHGALSCYESGNMNDGLRDGYVRAVLAKVGKPVQLHAGNGVKGMVKVAADVPVYRWAGKLPTLKDFAMADIE